MQEKNKVQLINLRLAAVYGCGFSGKLKYLSVLPDVLQKSAIALLGVMKPMVSFEKVVQTVVRSMDKSDTDDKSFYILRDSFEGSIYGAIKRGLDLIVVLIAVLLFGWMIPLIWLAVVFTSRGPGIYVQTRVGKLSLIHI